MELPARIEAAIADAVARAVAEIIRELLTVRVATEAETTLPAEQPPPAPATPMSCDSSAAAAPPPPGPRVCCECNDRPALRYRFKCGRCYGRQERERRRARRTQAASPNGTEPAAPPAHGADGPHAAGQPPTRRARGRTRELNGWLAGPDEHDAAAERRQLIASIEPVPEVDADGRTWTVRRLPPTVMPPAPAPAVAAD